MSVNMHVKMCVNMIVEMYVLFVKHVRKYV
jgi:hypothetical protein